MTQPQMFVRRNAWMRWLSKSDGSVSWKVKLMSWTGQIFSGLRLLTIAGMRSRLVDGLHGPIFHLHYLQRSEEFP